MAILTNVLSDARFALRLLRRSPGFALTLLTVLVLGIGATTAMFSVVESVLLQPLPFDHPEELMVLSSGDPDHALGPASVPDFHDWRVRSTTFASMAAIDAEAYTLTSPGAKPTHLYGVAVSGEYFATMRAKPLRGRLLTEDDDHLGGAHVAVIAASVWHGRFASDPAIVGRAITLNGVAYGIVGVAPEGFTFGSAQNLGMDIWTPLSVGSESFPAFATQRGAHFLNVVGRRKASATPAMVDADMARISRELETEYPDSNIKRAIVSADLHERMVGDSRTGVLVLFAAVALVFLVVCANVANLLLTRGAARRGEMAIRAALGADRARLVGQLVTEAVVVFALGGSLSAVAARLLLDRIVDALEVGGTLASFTVQMDAKVFAACFLLSIGCGVVFGLIPALVVSRVDPELAMKENASRSGLSRAQHRVRGALVAAQVALAFALLVGSGLALKAFARVSALPVGFDPNDRATAGLVLKSVAYDQAKIDSTVQAVLTLVRSQPGVTSVAMTDSLPFGGGSSSGSFDIEGRPAWPLGEEPNVLRNVVTPGYFATMGIPILRGRDFTDEDRAGTRHVAILTRATADRYFPGQDPIGQRIDWDDELTPEEDAAKVHHWSEVVGVVGDVRHHSVSAIGAPTAPESYMPAAQQPGHHFYMLVVHSPRAAELLRELPELVQRIDPDQAFSGRELLSDRVASTLGLQRMMTLLLTIFASAALFLATLGIFGLVSYSTSQRTRELGIRMALGSTPEQVVGLVMTSGARLVGVGLVIGLGCAVVVGRVLASRMPEVSAFDPSVFGIVPAVLGLASVVACLVPALRAVRIAPSAALRYE